MLTLLRDVSMAPGTSLDPKLPLGIAMSAKLPLGNASSPICIPKRKLGIEGD